MRLRNNGIITKADYIGKTVEEATKYGKEGGFESRVVQRDGRSEILDMDTKGNRLNFIVSHGKVTDVYGG
jgi:hypothetical protein